MVANASTQGRVVLWTAIISGCKYMRAIDSYQGQGLVYCATSIDKTRGRGYGLESVRHEAVRGTVASFVGGGKRRQLPRPQAAHQVLRKMGNIPRRIHSLGRNAATTRKESLGIKDREIGTLIRGTHMKYEMSYSVSATPETISSIYLLCILAPVPRATEGFGRPFDAVPWFPESDGIGISCGVLGEILLMHKWEDTGRVAWVLGKHEDGAKR